MLFNDKLGIERRKTSRKLETTWREKKLDWLQLPEPLLLLLVVSSVTRRWNQKLPNFTWNCPKVATHFLHNSDIIIKSPKSHQNIWATFCETICCQELVKIAQSGHTSGGFLFYRFLLLTTPTFLPAAIMPVQKFFQNYFARNLHWALNFRRLELGGQSYKQSTIEIYCYKDVMCQNLVVSQNLLLLAVWKIGHRGTTKPRVHQWSILFTLRIVICSSRVFDFVILWICEFLYWRWIRSQLQRQSCNLRA